MTVTDWIITGLIIALFGVLAIGGMFLNYQMEKERIKKEGAENAQHTADIIIKAEKTKDEVRSR